MYSAATGRDLRHRSDGCEPRGAAGALKGRAAYVAQRWVPRPSAFAWYRARSAIR
ncbi:hypothetical protein PMNALOAF_3682 [Methylobacterium adhaesivum]|jgi:hypothetical protein|nr:hypothetical protein PMNALOAF_3682 [Methylobacterium adhaesivum]